MGEPHDDDADASAAAEISYKNKLLSPQDPDETSFYARSGHYDLSSPEFIGSQMRSSQLSPRSASKHSRPESMLPDDAAQYLQYPNPYYSPGSARPEFSRSNRALASDIGWVPSSPDQNQTFIPPPLNIRLSRARRQPAARLAKKKADATVNDLEAANNVAVETTGRLQEELVGKVSMVWTNSEGGSEKEMKTMERTGLRTVTGMAGSPSRFSGFFGERDDSSSSGDDLGFDEDDPGRDLTVGRAPRVSYLSQSGSANESSPDNTMVYGETRPSSTEPENTLGTPAKTSPRSSLVCPVCGKKLLTKTLYKHIRIVHREARKRENIANRLQANVHTDSLPYKHSPVAMARGLDYRPLEKSKFRLLQLQPGRWHDPLDYQHHVADAHGCVNYAVYLPWPRGNVHINNAILLYDVKSSVLTPLGGWFGKDSLVTTMKIIRKHGAPESLWAAELCINFEDANEWKEQISLVPSIVRSASRFIIPISLRMFMDYADQRLPRLRKSVNEVLQCGQSIQVGEFDLSIMCNECRIESDVGDHLCFIPFKRRTWTGRCTRFIPSWPESWTWALWAGKSRSSWLGRAQPWLTLKPSRNTSPKDTFYSRDLHNAIESLDLAIQSIEADWDVDLTLKEFRRSHFYAKYTTNWDIGVAGEELSVYNEIIQRAANGLLSRLRRHNDWHFSLIMEAHNDSILNLIDFVRWYYILASEAKKGEVKSQSRRPETNAFFYLMMVEKPSTQGRLMHHQRELLKENQDEVELLETAFHDLNQIEVNTAEEELHGSSKPWDSAEKREEISHGALVNTRSWIHQEKLLETYRGSLARSALLIRRALDSKKFKKREYLYKRVVPLYQQFERHLAEVLLSTARQASASGEDPPMSTERRLDACKESRIYQPKQSNWVKTVNNLPNTLAAILKVISSGRTEAVNYHWYASPILNIVSNAIVAMRPSVRRGCQRVQWTCSCGRLMYGDYAGVNLDKLAQTLSRVQHWTAKRSESVIEEDQKEPNQTTQVNGLQDGELSSNSTTPTGPQDLSQQSDDSSGASISRSGSSSDTSEVSDLSQVSSSTSISLPSSLSVPTQSYLELCVNRNKYLTRLGEVPLVDANGEIQVSSDFDLFGELFSVIRIKLRGLVSAIH